MWLKCVAVYWIKYVIGAFHGIITSGDLGSRGQTSVKFAGYFVFTASFKYGNVILCSWSCIFLEDNFFSMNLIPPIVKSSNIWSSNNFSSGQGILTSNSLVFYMYRVTPTNTYDHVARLCDCNGEPRVFLKYENKSNLSLLMCWHTIHTLEICICSHHVMQWRWKHACVNILYWIRKSHGSRHWSIVCQLPTGC